MITLGHEQVLTVEETADYLRVSDTTVYRLIKLGRLPGRKVGGQWRILRSALEDYLNTTEVTEYENAGSQEPAERLPHSVDETFSSENKEDANSGFDGQPNGTL